MSGESTEQGENSSLPARSALMAVIDGERTKCPVLPGGGAGHVDQPVCLHLKSKASIKHQKPSQ